MDVARPAPQETHYRADVLLSLCPLCQNYQEAVGNNLDRSTSPTVNLYVVIPGSFGQPFTTLSNNRSLNGTSR